MKISDISDRIYALIKELRKVQKRYNTSEIDETYVKRLVREYTDSLEDLEYLRKMGDYSRAKAFELEVYQDYDRIMVELLGNTLGMEDSEIVDISHMLQRETTTIKEIVQRIERGLRQRT